VNVPCIAMASIFCSFAVLDSAEDMSQEGVMPCSFDGLWLFIWDMRRVMMKLGYACYYVIIKALPPSSAELG